MFDPKEVPAQELEHLINDDDGEGSGKYQHPLVEAQWYDAEDLHNKGDRMHRRKSGHYTTCCFLTTAVSTATL